MKHIMDIHKGDVYFSGSDIGWVVGHHFIVYGPLIRGDLKDKRKIYIFLIWGFLNYYNILKQKTKVQQLFSMKENQQELLIQDVFGVSLRNTRLKGFTLLLLL